MVGKFLHNLWFVKWITSNKINQGLLFFTIRRYRIVDGYHRWEILKRLAKHAEAEVKEKWEDFKAPCLVLPHITHKQDIAIAFSLFLT